MSKTFKKTLSIILTILMIVTCVPVAFALVEEKETVALEYVDDDIIKNDVSENSYLNYGANEGPEKLFDGNYNTKLCVLDRNHTGFDGLCDYYYVIAKTTDGSKACISGYQFVTGNDFPERDPSAWNVYGSNDNETWTLIDARTGVDMTQERNTAVDFELTTASAGYEYFKFEITEIKDGSKVFQLSEITLLAHDHTAGTETCGGHICQVCNGWFGEDESKHTYVNGVCQVCDYDCFHNFNGDAVCDICKLECLHPDEYQDCAGYHCDFCGLTYGEEGEHTDAPRNGLCDVCSKFIGIEIKVGEIKSVDVFDRNDDYNDYYTYVKFVPAISGEYILTSDSADSDPRCELFDKDFDGIYDENENQVCADDNYNVSGNAYNFKLSYEFTAGETYYFGLSDYDGDYTWNITLNYGTEGFITHQPTATEPYVEITDRFDVETYQWYKVVIDGVEITDENAQGRTADGEETATYDKENGWTGVFFDDSDEANFFKIELEAGQTVILQADKEPEMIGIWADYYDDREYYYDTGTNAVTFTASYDDVYNVFAHCDEGTHIRGYIGSFENVALEGENKNELQNSEIGKTYFCVATIQDGIEFTSDSFKTVYAISHQPTAAEPWVELNDDTDATYQWYTVEDGRVFFTDENAEPYSYNGNTSSYDPENGWTGVVDDFNDTAYFTVALDAGDSITVEISGTGFYGVGIYNYETGDGKFSYEEDGVSIYELVAEYDGNYTVYTDNDASVIAYVGDNIYTEVEGETAAQLGATEVADYVCDITFADGTTEMSDAFTLCAHTDEDGDYTCDNGCGYEYPADNTDNTDNTENSDVCDYCGRVHPTFIQKLFCKITQFFVTLFTALGLW